MMAALGVLWRFRAAPQERVAEDRILVQERLPDRHLITKTIRIVKCLRDEEIPILGPILRPIATTIVVVTGAVLLRQHTIIIAIITAVIMLEDLSLREIEVLLVEAADTMTAVVVEIRGGAILLVAWTIGATLGNDAGTMMKKMKWITWKID